jgi:type III secretion system FlhB-like substrate exporter
MTPFNHVKVVSISTEREYHIRHGLHLNKKGKHWIADNLIKEIKNLYLPLNSDPPIVLQWKDSNENTIQQVNPATAIMVCSATRNPLVQE